MKLTSVFFVFIGLILWVKVKGNVTVIECGDDPCSITSTLNPNLVVDDGQKTCEVVVYGDLIEQDEPKADDKEQRLRLVGFSPILFMMRAHLKGNCVGPFRMEWKWFHGFPNVNPKDEPVAKGIGLNTFRLVSTKHADQTVKGALAVVDGKGNEHIGEHSYKVTISPPPLRVIYSGGRARAHLQGTPLLISVEPSFDPDGLLNLTEFKYQWNCSFGSRDELLDKVEVPLKRLRRRSVIESLSSSNRRVLDEDRRSWRRSQNRKRSNGSLTTKVGLDGTTMKPSSLVGLSNRTSGVETRKQIYNFCLGPGIYITEIPFLDLMNVSGYDTSRSYQVQVMVRDKKGDEGRQGVIERQLFQLMNFSSNIYIGCRYNCYPLNFINPKEKIVFEAVCDGCESTITSIQWNVLKKIPAEDPIDDTDCPGLILSGKVLSIPRKCFDYGQGLELLLFVPPTNDTENVTATVNTDRIAIATKHEMTFGACNSTPSDGVALITPFSLHCKGFQPTTSKGVFTTYTYYQMLSGLDGREYPIVLHYSASTNSPIFVHLAPSSKTNNVAKMKVRVIEEKMDSFDFLFDVTVSPLNLDKNCADNFLSCVEKITGQFSESMWLQGQTRRLLNVMQIVVHLMNVNLETNSKNILMRQKIREKIFDSVFNVTNIFAEPTIQQLATFVQTLFHGSPYEVSLSLREKSLNRLLELSKELYTISAVRNDTTALLAEVVAQDILRGVDEVYRIAKDQSTREFAEKMFNIFKEGGDTSFKSSDEFGKSLCEKEKERYEMYKQIVSQLGLALSPFIYSYEVATVLKAEGLTVWFQTIAYEQVKSLSLGLNDFKINIDWNRTRPNQKELFDLKLLLFSWDVFPGKCSKYNPTKGSVWFEAKQRDSQLVVTDELGAVHFQTALEGSLQYPKNCRGMSVPNAAVTPVGKRHVYKLTFGPYDRDLTPRNMIVVIAAPVVNGEPFILEYGAVKPNETANESISVEDETKGGRRLVVSELRYMMDGYRETSGNTIVRYVSVTITNETVKKITDGMRGRSNSIFRYLLDFLQVECFHYDDAKGEWTSEPQARMEIDVSHKPFFECIYDKLGSMYSVAAKTLQTVIREETPTQREEPPIQREEPPPVRPTESEPKSDYEFSLIVPFNLRILIIVFILLLLLFVLFLVISLIDMKRVCVPIVTVLKDVDPVNKYAYLVSVRTGAIAAPSFSVVALRAHGSDLDSEHHVLASLQKDIFERTSEDHFLIFTDRSLGGLQSLSLFQRFASDYDLDGLIWCLKRILVSDLSSKENWRLNVDELWTAPTDVKFTAEKLGRKCMSPFCKRLKYRFHEYYLLNGFIFRPIFTAFSSAVRLILLFLFLFLAFFINLAFRGFPSTSPTEHIGLYEFKVLNSDLILAAITAAVLLPTSLIFLFLVRHLFSVLSWKVFIDIDRNWKEDLDNWKCGQMTVGVSERIISEKLIDCDNKCEYKCSNRVQFIVFSKLNKNIKKRASIEEKYRGCDAKGMIVSSVWRYWVGNCLLWFVLAALICVTIVFGLRFSQTSLHLWIVSSLIGFAACLLVLHPLFLIVFELIHPLKENNVKNELLQSNLSLIQTRRESLITEHGTVDEYREYLRFLRQDPIYQL